MRSKLETLFRRYQVLMRNNQKLFYDYAFDIHCYFYPWRLKVLTSVLFPAPQVGTFRKNKFFLQVVVEVDLPALINSNMMH